MRQTYSGTIGYEFIHITRVEDKQWIQRRIEGEEYHEKISSSRKRKIMRQLSHAEGFEQFLHLKYPGTKRFGLDGAESAIPLLEASIKRVRPNGAYKRWSSACPTEAASTCLPTSWRSPTPRSSVNFRDSRRVPTTGKGLGDVKYHLGTSAERIMDDMPIYVSLSPNPSHLEAVDPRGHGPHSR